MHGVSPEGTDHNSRPVSVISNNISLFLRERFPIFAITIKTWEKVEWWFSLLFSHPMLRNKTSLKTLIFSIVYESKTFKFYYVCLLNSLHPPAPLPPISFMGEGERLRWYLLLIIWDIRYKLKVNDAYIQLPYHEHCDANKTGKRKRFIKKNYKKLVIRLIRSYAPSNKFALRFKIKQWHCFFHIAFFIHCSNIICKFTKNTSLVQLCGSFIEISVSVTPRNPY